MIRVCFRLTIWMMNQIIGLDNRVYPSLGFCHQLGELCDSDDDISVDETSSNSSNNNNDTESWVEDWSDIRDFKFDYNSSGIILNISESVLLNF